MCYYFLIVDAARKFCDIFFFFSTILKVFYLNTHKTFYCVHGTHRSEIFMRTELTSQFYYKRLVFVMRSQIGWFCSS